MTEKVSPRYEIEQPPVGERRRLLQRVPHGATVLDIGCWSGEVGRFLINTQAATVDGIEPDREMARLAAINYRRVFQLTVEEALEQLLPESAGTYDAIVFYDVLEHLVQPWDVLSRARALLTPTGHAVVSIPNVAHWSVRKQLLLGRWSYEEHGLLDRTHLRFFTVDSAEELLTTAGWRVVWRSASLGQPPLIRLPDHWLRILRRWPKLFGVQTLLEAEPCSASRETSFRPTAG